MKLKNLCEGFDCHNLPPVVETAVRAKVVRTLEFTAVRALVVSFDLERIVRTTVAAAVGRYFPLGDGHGGTCASNNYNQFRWPP